MKKQIPNILTVLRFFMIPVFIILYFKGGDGKFPYFTAFMYVLAWATDVIDGRLARKYGWVTDIGKIIDPLADKLMQFAALVCFTVEDRIFLLALIPMVIKELGMLIGAAVILKNRKIVVQAKWFGKFATVGLFLIALAKIIIRGNHIFNVIAAIAMLCLMMFAGVMYLLGFKEQLKSEAGK